MEELVQVKTVSQLLADRFRAYLSGNDVFIPTSASMDQPGEVRLGPSIHVGDILRERRMMADGADKELWGGGCVFRSNCEKDGQTLRK